MDKPSISIVTPSFNQARFLEPCIRSILDQNYPRLEYGVVDGGSTDGSVEILRRYADRLAFWTSEKDGGPYDAINKGFARTSGEIMGWLNSDDMLLPGALSTVGDVFATFPAVEWITTLLPVTFNQAGQAVECPTRRGYSRNSFMRGGHLVGIGRFSHGWIQQESTYWRRSLWDRAGGKLDTSVTLAADFELWARFYQHAELHGVAALIGGFRKHGDGQRSALHYREYVEQALEVLRRYGGRPYGPVETLAMRLRRRLGAAGGRRILFENGKWAIDS
jgi:glycosyltransferase involved in cell wall biosynthesis